VLKAEADSETTQIGILYTNRDHLMRSGCERKLVYYQNDVFFVKATRQGNLSCLKVFSIALTSSQPAQVSGAFPVALPSRNPRTFSSSE
jgi:hypothetical protein